MSYEYDLHLDSCLVHGESCKYEALGCDKICNALSMISGKWKLKLLYLIGYNEVIRYGELKRQATPITHLPLIKPYTQFLHTRFSNILVSSAFSY